MADTVWISPRSLSIDRRFFRSPFRWKSLNWVTSCGLRGSDTYRPDRLSGLVRPGARLRPSERIERRQERDEVEPGPDTKALFLRDHQICNICYGDSGGLIINQYGELAGILWGSMVIWRWGHSVSAFRRFDPGPVPVDALPLFGARVFARASRREIPLKKIAMPSVPAQNRCAPPEYSRSRRYRSIRTL